MARVNTTACIVYMDGAEFDGIFIVDGLGIMWDGVYNSEIIRVVQESLRAGKKVAAVGHGVAALCNVTDDRGNFIVAGKQVQSLPGVCSAALTSALALPVFDHIRCATRDQLSAGCLSWMDVTLLEGNCASPFGCRCFTSIYIHRGMSETEHVRHRVATG